MNRTFLRNIVLVVFTLVGTAAFGVPTIDGSISGSEGWLHFTEDPDARPVVGGSTTHSDNIGESSSFFWRDDLNSVNHTFQDNRADVMEFYVAHDVNNLYLAVAGPTAPFNSFTDTGGNNDQGDLFIAIDTGGGSPSGSLNVTGTHNSFAGVRAVDFLGWTPSYFVGVQYVDNGGGSGGRANLEQAGTHNVGADEGNFTSDGGFQWRATINGSATYDSVNGNAGEFEFQIPWNLLGLSSGGPSAGQPLRFAMYITQNFAQYDPYDSGPGFGNGTSHEQIGDNPGDPDSAGQFGPSDAGSLHSPGSDYTADLSLSVGHDDGVDTIEEHYSFVVNVVPEPGSIVMMGLGLLGIAVWQNRRTI